MNRKYVLFGNLVLLVGFVAGYAAAFFTAKKIAPQPVAAIITQAEKPTETAPAVKDAQPAAVPAATDTPASTDVATLQAQLAEKSAKITELQQKLASANHDTVTPEEDTPEYREKLANDLMELTRTKELIQQSFKATVPVLGKDLTQEGQDALGQAIGKIYSWDKMEKPFTKLYTDVFSAQELNDMAEFYRSDVGTAMLKKTPELMQKTMQMVQQLNQEAQPKIVAELEAISKKYKAKTASSAKPETPPAKN